MSQEKKIYTLSEVSKHKESADCWLIINGKVFDVSKFTNDHPGGEDVMLCASGKDATEEFEKVGHSSAARALLKDFYIGEADVSTLPAKEKRETASQISSKQDDSSEFFFKLLQLLVPLLILGSAFGIRFYVKSINE